MGKSVSIVANGGNLMRALASMVFLLCFGCEGVFSGGSDETDAGVVPSPDAHTRSDGGVDGGTEPADSGNPDGGRFVWDAGPDSGIHPDAGFDTTAGTRVFFSGHSLINLDMPKMLEHVALGLGKAHAYQSQLGTGANMETRYTNPNGVQNKSGASPLGFSVIDEIPNGYDTLVVTEAVPVFGHIVYHDGFGYAARYYDLAVANGPDTRVFLYESWPHRENMSYAEWVNFTRFELMKWECTAAQVNQARPGPLMRVLPAGQALADLVAQVLAGDVPGLSDPNALFGDDIHLTDLGQSYMALVVYAALYGAPADGADLPSEDVFGNPFSPLPAEATWAAFQSIAFSSVRAYVVDDGRFTRGDAECLEHFRASAPSEWVYENEVRPLFQ